MSARLILRLQADDRPGIVAAIAAFAADHGCDIREAAVFGDPDTGQFFLRAMLDSPLARMDLARPLEAVAHQLKACCRLNAALEPLPTLIAVSKT